MKINYLALMFLVLFAVVGILTTLERVTGYYFHLIESQNPKNVDGIFLFDENHVIYNNSEIDNYLKYHIKK